MSRREKREHNSTPFFARYLEGQEARVEGRKDIAYKKAPGTVVQTLKFPSDRDELEYRPYYLKAEDVPAAMRGPGRVVTLKFPSDNDEDTCIANYANAADVPAGGAKSKGTASVRLKKKTVKK